MFRDLHHLPDPVPDAFGDHYKPFNNVYSQVTLEQYRPSLSAGKQGHGMPFSPTAQTAKNRILECSECALPRVLYAERKVKAADLQVLDPILEEVQFSCGLSLQDLFTDADENQAAFHRRLYVRANLTCTMHVEQVYYSAACFPLVCIHCGSQDDLVHGAGADHMQTCPVCLAAKPRLQKRKRNIVGGNSRKKKKNAGGVAEEPENGE